MNCGKNPEITRFFDILERQEWPRKVLQTLAGA